MPIWQIDQKPVDYQAALEAMESHVQAMLEGSAPEKVWLLEHPPLYTKGTSSQEGELLDPCFPVYEAGRGGRYTYHGPGQRVAYVMIDLKKRRCDVRAYIDHLEAWVTRALASFGIQAEKRAGRVGLWVNNNGKDQKIAAVGVRIRRWVTYHGVAINVNPDLSHFSGIVPCGLADYGVTSMRALGIAAEMQAFDKALQAAWQDDFVFKTEEMPRKMA